MNPSTRLPSIGLAAATLIVLSGCASSLSGVGSTESFACKAPVGAQCTSISGVYANANANPFATRAMHETPRPPQGLLAAQSVPAAPLATQTSTQTATPANASPVPASGASAAVAAAPSAAALRSAPRVLRLWIAPWEDADGDLHDASFVHVVVDTGRWLIDRVRPAPRSRLDIATPPLVPAAMPAATPEAKAPADLAPTEP